MVRVRSVALEGLQGSRYCTCKEVSTASALRVHRACGGSGGANGGGLGGGTGLGGGG